MFIPLVLLIFAVLAAGVVAYGASPFWAQYAHGIDAIVWTRRLEWPLVALSLILCLILLGLIVSGKRRAWWLIGLGPILALFVHRFVTDPAGGLAILDRIAAQDYDVWKSRPSVGKFAKIRLLLRAMIFRRKEQRV